MSRLHFNLHNQVNNTTGASLIPPLDWTDAKKVAHNLAALHTTEFGPKLYKQKPTKRTGYGFRSRGKFGEFGYSMSVRETSVKRPTRPASARSAKTSTRKMKESIDILPLGMPSGMLIDKPSSPKANRRIYKSPSTAPTGQFSSKSLLPLLKSSDQFLNRPAVEQGQAQQSHDIKSPSKFLCNQCTHLIERDAQFWEKEWHKGGDFLLRFLEDHMEHYPNFIMTFLSRFKKQIRKALELDPMLLAVLASTEATKGLMNKVASEKPEVLIELAQKSPPNVIVQLFQANPKALNVYIEENPECLKEAEISPQAIAEAIIAMGPEDKQAVVEEAFKDDTEPRICKTDDISATFSAQPEKMAEVFVEHTDAIVSVLKDNTDLLLAILAGLKEKIAAVLSKDPEDLARFLKMLDPAALLEALRIMSEQNPDFLQPLFGKLPALKTYLQKNLPFLLQLIVETCQAKPSFVKTLFDGVQQLGPHSMGTKDKDLIQIFIDEHPELFVCEVCAKEPEASLEEENQPKGNRFASKSGGMHSMPTISAGGGNAGGVGDVGDGSGNFDFAKFLFDLLAKGKLELGMQNLLEALTNEPKKFNKILADALLNDPNRIMALLNEHPKLKTTILSSFAKKIVRRKPQEGKTSGGDGGGVTGDGARDSDDPFAGIEVLVIEAGEELGPEYEDDEESGRRKESVHATEVKKVNKPHPWEKFLAGKLKTKDSPMGLRALQAFVYKVYEQKTVADAIDVRQGNGIANTAEFVLDYLLMQYGQKKAVKAKLKVLIKSMKACSKDSPLIDVFNRLCGFRVEKPLDTSILSTILWGVQTLIKANGTAIRLDLNMLDNQERMAIKRASGIEINLASMNSEPATMILKKLCVTMDQDSSAIAEQIIKKEIVNYDEKQIISLVTFIEALTGCLLNQQSIEHDKFSLLFKKVDEDESGIVDYEEFTNLIKSTPALSHLSDYQVCSMYNSATEDCEMTEDIFIRLAQGEMKTLVGQDVLSNIDAISSEDAGYLAILSGHVKKMFDDFDPDKTGEIAIAKFPELMMEVQEGISTVEISRIIKLIDVDGSGSISFAEFLDWWRDYALNQKFTKFDSDGSGELNQEELQGLLQSLGIDASDDQMAHIISSIDLDNDSNVSFAELVQWFGVFDARKAFDQYDADNSGEIGSQELNALLIDLGWGGAVSPEILQQALEKLDSDGTGEISFEEFLPWWNATQKAKRKEKLGQHFNKTENHVSLRRQSDQMTLLSNNQAYLKMSGLRQNMLVEENDRVQAMIAKIAKDYKLDLKELSAEYCPEDD